MAQFIKFIIASCLGTVLAGLLLGFIGIAFIGGLISETETTPRVHANSVLEITLDKPIPEQTNNLDVNPFDLKNQKIWGLNAMVKTLEHAAEDDKIKGIYLNLDLVSAGLPTLTTLRDALLKFKESGKFIIANSKYYSQSAYYLASAADKIYLSPAGSIDLHGFAATIPFYKEMLDKIGVKMQVFYAGQYKSATEPFRRKNISDQNRYQTREFLFPAFEDFLRHIATSRNKPVAEIRALIDNLDIKTADDALQHGLVDEVGYADQAEAEMKSKIGLESDEKLHKTNFYDYVATAKPKTDYSVKDKIAVIYAEGAIIPGKGSPGQIGDDKYTKYIRKAREDKKVKALVLRVNSPGGSPIASENIWREIELTKKAGKPVVVSMGDYAASGGYYISCNADYIIAEENTLTGSIGVFMVLPNVQKLMKDKIGISYDTVKTTRHSNGLGIYFDLAPEEVNFLNQTTQKYYAMFKKRVADGRQLTLEQVEEIAQGRVWSGEDAVGVGLVDQTGNLSDALAKAAELAGLDEYRTTEYPEVKEPIQILLEELTGQETAAGIKAKILENEFGEYYSDYKYIKETLDQKGVQAVCPVRVIY